MTNPIRNVTDLLEAHSACSPSPPGAPCEGYVGYPPVRCPRPASWAVTDEREDSVSRLCPTCASYFVNGTAETSVLLYGPETTT
jgi:hypothetical protein